LYQILSSLLSPKEKGSISYSKSTVINMLRLTFCRFCSKLKKILHNPKRQVFFKKIIIEEPEKKTEINKNVRF